MNRLTLTWKQDAPRPVDGAFLNPASFAGMSLQAIRQLPVRVGRANVALGEMCDVEMTGTGGDREQSAHVTLVGAPPLDRLGAGMTGGALVVDGDVGDDLGASMSGGSIHVKGSAAHHVGGPDISASRGMTGGTIAIEGDAGDFVGLRMRRGMIVVAGRCGRSPGYRMLAGSVVVGQGPIDAPGLEMRRGTIISLDQEHLVALGGSFVEATASQALSAAACPAVLLTIREAIGHIEGLPSVASDRLPHGHLRLWHGDGFELNRGEIIQWVDEKGA